MAAGGGAGDTHCSQESSPVSPIKTQGSGGFRRAAHAGRADTGPPSRVRESVEGALVPSWRHRSLVASGITACPSGPAGSPRGASGLRARSPGPAGGAGRPGGRGGAGRCREVRDDEERRRAVQGPQGAGEVQGGAGRCGEVRGDAGSCGTMWGGAGRSKGRGARERCGAGTGGGRRAGREGGRQGAGPRPSFQSFLQSHVASRFPGVTPRARRSGRKGAGRRETGGRRRGPRSRAGPGSGGAGRREEALLRARAGGGPRAPGAGLMARRRPPRAGSPRPGRARPAAATYPASR